MSVSISFDASSVSGKSLWLCSDYEEKWHVLYLYICCRIKYFAIYDAEKFVILCETMPVDSDASCRKCSHRQLPPNMADWPITACCFVVTGRQWHPTVLCCCG